MSPGTFYIFNSMLNLLLFPILFLSVTGLFLATAFMIDLAIRHNGRGRRALLHNGENIWAEILLLILPAFMVLAMFYFGWNTLVSGPTYAKKESVPLSADKSASIHSSARQEGFSGPGLKADLYRVRERDSIQYDFPPEAIGSVFKLKKISSINQSDLILQPYKDPYRLDINYRWMWQNRGLLLNLPLRN